MSIMAARRDEPIANARLIATAVLHRLEDGDASDLRTTTLNSLFRLASVMTSHRFYGKSDPEYARLVEALDQCANKMLGGTDDKAWERLKNALRQANRHDSEGENLVREFANAMKEAMAR